jgi:hypothetical protein
MRHRHGLPAIRQHPLLGAAAVGIALASSNAHADGVNGTIGCLDARAAGGPYIQLDLDVALTKEVKRAR